MRLGCSRVSLGRGGGDTYISGDIISFYLPITKAGHVSSQHVWRMCVFPYLLVPFYILQKCVCKGVWLSKQAGAKA